MVYDCFPFFNELDILELRLNILDPYVDRFIIEESTMTFSGEPKELVFKDNMDRFARFWPKITHIVVTDTPVDAVTHERDYFQKNRLAEGLKDASDTDVIIFGDADEIPSPAVLEKIIADFDPDKVYHLAQRNFYAFINMEEKSGNLLSITGEFDGIEGSGRKWLGTKICSVKNIPQEGIVRLRDLVKPSDPRSVRVADGGWHFGYMGGDRERDVAKRIGVKVKAAAHQEYNDREILAETMDHLILGEDIFGRDARFVRIPVDDSYPAFLTENKDRYSHLIMPEITAADRIRAKLDLSAGRFFRKVRRRLFRR